MITPWFEGQEKKFLENIVITQDKDKFRKHEKE